MTVSQNLPNTLSESSDEIDLAKLFGTLLDHRWLIIGITVFFMLIGIAYALLATPIYKADALIQIEEKSSGMPAFGEMADMFASESSATTEIQVIQSRMVLGKTVDKLDLTTVAKPKYFPAIGKGMAKIMGDNDSIDISHFNIPQVLYLNVEFVNYKLTVTNPEIGTYELFDSHDNQILTGRVGELAQKGDYRLFVADLQASQEMSFTLQKRSRLDAVIWLQSHLAVSEQGKKTGVLQLSFTGENRVHIENILNNISQDYFLQNVERNSAEAENSLAFLQQHLPAVKTELVQAEEKLNDFRQENDSIDLGLEAKSSLEVMVKLEAQLNELTFKESEISQLFTKEHPAYISLMNNRQTLLNERERLNKTIQKLPKTQRDILRMMRDVEVNQELYLKLLNKIQELNIVKASTVGNVRILDKAEAYTRAIKPKKALVLMLATLLGAMLGIGLTLLRAALHRGVESPEQIEQLGLPVYASIPKSDWQAGIDIHLKRKKKLKEYEALLAETNPADLAIEALRGLRTSLHFAMMEAKNNVVMISGPAPGIGKSFVSVNFAAVLAKTGQKVLIVDADMRKGYLQRQFNLKSDDGLSDLLSGKLEIKEVVKSSGIENLDIVTRGAVPPNPSELLMHPRFEDFVTWATKEYDIVLIDTPPVLAVTDPSIVGALAGTTLLVARFGVSSVKEIEIAYRRFEQSGINVKGFVLNAVEQKARNANEVYSYSYEPVK
ncbi:polysaccharide biosynthesis tyrosine autokinase [Shewanella surugensis]|uniref:Polysaccharide biosynthesis tyrosine autokinase n=1 Tax=Shewanella surugensis TaxID=212020 RepID=A0ABT0L862_9GAMM|nr:polysaccharide biosynthesis tyrosine autokinase [Shewanella surugensis]MCL1123888.1 polysaccharide biosynthesis tyrosine autokinase [Shewanella surugensis]